MAEYSGEQRKQESRAIARCKSGNRQLKGILDNRSIIILPMQPSNTIQCRDILNSPKYTQNFKNRHVHNGNVTPDMAAVRLNNNPPPPSSTIIDQNTVPRGVKNVEDSNQITKEFEITAQGWNVYYSADNELKGKEVQRIIVRKNTASQICHLERCIELPGERMRNADGVWV